MDTSTDTVEMTCWGCEHTITVPVLHVDDSNVIHIDHEYLAQHHATHEGNHD
jgi:hypothetical protein